MNYINLLLELIQNPEKFAGLITIILAVLVGFNMVLVGISKILGAIKDKTQSQLDNKLFAFLSKIAGFSQKVADFISANSKPNK